MKTILPALLTLPVFLMLSIFSTSAMAEIVTGDAVVNAPGTLGIAGRGIVLDDIRMPGPGTACSEWRGQRQVRFDCHEHATAALQSLVTGEAVACAVNDSDIGTCYVDGQDIAEILVREGWAGACGRTNRYVSLEEAAREERQGMWTGNFTLDTSCPRAAGESQR